MTFNRTRRDQGVTLVEILIALIVMIVGVIGILALFPPAMQSATESMEETNAAILGESVSHALTTAFRSASIDPATGRLEVTLTHDLEAGANKAHHTILLPQLPTTADLNWHHFPGTASPAATAPGSPDPGAPINLTGYVPEEDPRVFRLGGDPWANDTVQKVHDTNDPTDAYRQFAFSLDIRKVHSMAYLEGKPKPGGAPYTAADLENATRLYEVRVYVFRVAAQGGSVGGSTVAGPGPAGAEFRKLIAIVTKRISIR